VLAAVRAGAVLDRTVMAFVLLGQSIPTFWLGLVMIRIFAVNFRLVPVSGYGTPLHLLMTAVVLGLYLAALLARVTRSEMLEAMAQDYVRTARAKGLPERAVTLAARGESRSRPTLAVPTPQKWANFRSFVRPKLPRRTFATGC
jgi:peptide/nickel transport system permease protein